MLLLKETSKLSERERKSRMACKFDHQTKIRCEVDVLGKF